MASAPRLTIAYITKRPESAGRVLASMPAADSAAFLKDIPTRYAIRAVAQMNSRQASSIVQLMEETAGAALIRELGFTEASMILRQINPAERDRFLAVLPNRLRREFEMSLAFPTGTVGAHMTTAIVTVSEAEKAATALDLVKRADRDHGSVVFVVGENGKLAGVISASALLQQPSRSRLAEIIDTSCAALSAHERLEAVADLDAWHDYDRLPVVTRRGEVFGALSRRTLRQLDRELSMAFGVDTPSLTNSMLEALAASSGGLVNLLLTSFSAQPGQDGPHEH